MGGEPLRPHAVCSSVVSRGLPWSAVGPTRTTVLRIFKARSLAQSVLVDGNRTTSSQYRSSACIALTKAEKLEGLTMYELAPRS